MWEHFHEFMARPFRSEMDAFDWFMFVGLLVVIMILWGIILRHIRETL